jgi:hypothetical protein
MRNRRNAGNETPRPAPPSAGPGAAAWWQHWWAPGVLILGLVLFFYATPLTSPNATIQWDAVDVHLGAQNYFSRYVTAGQLPHWTPNVFSGMPFLADPQVGAWYPLNWPFFLAGITPKAIQWELALHALLAALGAWLLARDLLQDNAAAVLAGLGYGLSGGFAGNSSHVAYIQAASLLPWLLWAFRRAVEVDALRYGAAAALAGGCAVLAGHFQVALYSFFGLALFTAGGMACGLPHWRRRAPLLMAAVSLAAVLLTSIQTLPGLELAANSIRSSVDFVQDAGPSLTPGSLLTLFLPNYYGALSGTYTGPSDITQYYFYPGIVVLVLAAVGLRSGNVRWLVAAMAVPAAWYGFGPAAGLYRLVGWLPAFRNVRAPVNIWFVAALGIALLSAAGAAALRARWRSQWATAALIAVAFLDLWYWNMNQNPLAYGRNSFEERYGGFAANFERATSAVRQNPLHRLWAERDTNSFGPLNGGLASQTETTYGYNPLELRRYHEYMAAAAANPKLLDGLAVTTRIEPGTGRLAPNPTVLPRVSVPPSVVRADATGVASRLASLDPAREALVDTAAPAVEQDPAARAEVLTYGGDRYRIRYSAARPTLLRIAVPFFPGWTAAVEGRPAPVVAADHALSGVVVPAGTHELDFFYRSNWFTTGAAVSAIALLTLLAALVWRRPARFVTAP